MDEFEEGAVIKTIDAMDFLEFLDDSYDPDDRRLIEEFETLEID